MLESVLFSAIKAIWLAWAVYWVIAARRAKATRWRENWGVRVLDASLLLIAVLLFAAGRYVPAALCVRFLPRGPVAPSLGALLTGAGFLLAIWARAHLGRNWSGTVTLKEDHALIRAGPYARVRHPIYSGVLLALAGTALAVGEWRGMLAFAAVFVALLRRVRAEERHLSEIFPQYDRYRQETAALIPFVF